MRRIVMFNHVSADGYFESASGDLGWVIQEPGVQATAAERMGSVDTILFGRKTYDMFEKAWRYALDDPDSAIDPHKPGHRSEAARGQAMWINEASKVVVSSSLRNPTWKRSRVVRSIDPVTVDALKREAGKDIIVFGSGTVISQLSAHRLVDEYMFLVSPVLLGSGRMLVSGLGTAVNLRLIDATSFPSGVSLVRYAPAPV